MARAKDNYRGLSGSEKAAIFMLALPQSHSAKLFGMMDDEEIKELSMTMANLGMIDATIVERLFVEFADQRFLAELQDFDAGMREALKKGMSREEIIKNVKFEKYQDVRNYYRMNLFISSYHHLLTTGKPEVAMP